MRSGLLAFLVCAVASLAAAEPADASNKIKIGVLKFGTVSWVLDTIQANGLDKAEGIELDIVPLASTQATTVGLQGGSVDIIATDWLWVSRERSSGGDFTFSPFTTALGVDHGAPELADQDACRPQGQEDRRGRRSARQELALDRGLCAAHRQSRSQDRDHAGIRRSAAAQRARQAGRDRCRAQFLALCGAARGGGLHPADRGRGRGERAWRQGRGRHGRLCVQRQLGQGESRRTSRASCALRPRPTSCSPPRIRNGSG